MSTAHALPIGPSREPGTDPRRRATGGKRQEIRLVIVADDGGEVEREDAARVGDLADVDVEDHAVVFAYACVR